MKLIYIRSTMEPKNYSTIRSILKREQGEKIAPYIFKINDTQTLDALSKKRRITYEIYQEERKIINVGKRKHRDDALLPNKKQKSSEGKQSYYNIDLFFLLILKLPFKIPDHFLNYF